ncbi:MAG: aspartate 1-decarboxylase [Spirochaetes bacterium]|nr:aspartate 1-decarboxylase [Spirochaetota bacterium]
MLRKFLRVKIHRATVTFSDLNYVGSITIDENIMKEAGLLENEVVSIYNINNGERFETYVIKGEAGSGIIGINGAAARKVQVGDKIIIVNYVYLYENEINSLKPKILIMNDENKIEKIL